LQSAIFQTWSYDHGGIAKKNAHIVQASGTICGGQLRTL
jgi:hypothetical protein